MERSWVWAMAIGLVLAGGAGNSDAQVAYDLTKLKSLCIHIGELSTKARQDHNLSEGSIGSHIYVWLKSKLPRLQVDQYSGQFTGTCETNKPSLFANVHLSTATFQGAKAGYFGSIELEVIRSTFWESGKQGLGIAYTDSSIHTGPMGAAEKHILSSLDKLLTKFAAEYYKAGNP